MTTFEKWDSELRAEQEQQDPATRLAALKKRKEDLETFIGTDAWTTEDATLLVQLTDEIIKLEKSLQGKAA